MNRPVIVVDLDNVVYDWVKTMILWLRQNGVLKAPPTLSSEWDRTNYFMKKYTQWSVWEDLEVPKGEFIRWWRLGIEAGEVYKSGPEIAGARSALWKLSDAEWHIHIATSRLTKFGLHDLIVENTSSWLRNHNIPYRSLSFTANKLAISAEAIVDDRADNMATVPHGKTFLFPANHNAGRYVSASEQQEYWEGVVTALT